MKISESTSSILIIEDRKGYSYILPMLFIMAICWLGIYLFFFNKPNDKSNLGLESSIGLLLLVIVLIANSFFFIEFIFGKEIYRFDKVSGSFYLQRQSIFTSKRVNGLLKDIQAIQLQEDDSGEDSIYYILIISNTKPINLPLRHGNSDYNKDYEIASAIATFLQLPSPITIKK